MRAIPIPPAPVMPVIGRAFTTAGGDRHVEYTDAAGRRYACVSDGATHQWYELDPAASPAGEDLTATPSKEL